jgi:hypothetical protein
VKGLHRRRRGAVRDARIIAIALEGEEAGEEFRYFSRLREVMSNGRRFIVELLPTPVDTHESSPEAVIRRLDEYVSVNALRPEIDALWLVFDIDTWPEAMLSNVTQLASQKRYRLGISNPCFELWLLLHFSGVDPDGFDWPDNPRKRSQEAKQWLAQARSRGQASLQPTLSSLRDAVARAERLVLVDHRLERWPSFPGTHVHMIVLNLREAQLLPKD